MIWLPIPRLYSIGVLRPCNKLCLRLYDSSTGQPTPISKSATGVELEAYLEISRAGFPIDYNGSAVAPHIDRNYNLEVFKIELAFDDSEIEESLIFISNIRYKDAW